jgi:HEAT repeat protein
MHAMPTPALALAHPDPGAREEAARAIVATGSAEAAEAVAPLIAHPDIAVRNLAGDVLVRLGACAVDALPPYLDDEDGDVRKFAVDVLAQLPAQALAPRIAEALDDEDANVRLAAIDALAELGAAPFADALVARYEAEPLARPSVIAALGACGCPQGSALIIDALGDDDPVVQLAAAEALAELGDDALPLLTAALQRETGATRAVVVDALVRWSEAHGAEMPEGIEEDLLAMLDDTEEAYRRSAAQGLRRVADRLDTARLLAHAGHDDALDVVFFEILTARPNPFAALLDARLVMAAGPAASFAVALLAQGRIADGDLAMVGPFLEARYDELDSDTKLAVVTLCARFGRPELEGILQRAVADPDPSVSSTALDAVEAAGLAIPSPHAP